MGKSLSTLIRVHNYSEVSVNLLQHTEVKWLRLSVSTRDVVDGFDGFGITALGEQIAGRFGHLEDKHTNECKHECQTPKSDHHISPAHVVRPLAGLRRGIRRTGEVCQEDPSDESNNDLSKVPPRGQGREQVLMRSRNEFQEDHGIDGNVSSRCKTNDCPHDAEAGEIAESGNTCSEYPTDQESKVESWLATDEIGRDTPEGGADDETAVVRDGAESNHRYVGEFELNGRLNCANALGPAAFVISLSNTYLPRTPYKLSVIHPKPVTTNSSHWYLSAQKSAWSKLASQKSGFLTNLPIPIS